MATDHLMSGQREFGPQTTSAATIRRSINAAALPPSIGWVSTIGENGVAVLARRGYCTVLGAVPSISCLGNVGEKEIVRTVRSATNFVLNAGQPFVRYEFAPETR